VVIRRVTVRSLGTASGSPLPQWRFLEGLPITLFISHMLKKLR
jgi:hypothetical protein